MAETRRQKVVILGAGYGGVLVAQGLGELEKELGLDVVLINKHDYHQIITQLHEPAAGSRGGDEISIPLSRLVGREVSIIKGEITKIAPEQKQVSLDQNRVVEYDYLIIALGSEPEYFQIPGLREHSFPLRSLNAARLIKAHIENCLARYKINPQDESLLNFVIGGAGFTGVEMAGELAEWLPRVAPKYDVPRKKINLICVEGCPQVLFGLGDFISNTTAQVLSNKGVELRLGTPIKEVTGDYIKIGEQKLPTKTMIWTGGVRGNILLEEAGFSCDRGRAYIDELLRSVDYENVFIIGDCSFLVDKTTGRAFAPTAQLAIQQAQHLVKNLERLFSGQEQKVFRFDNKGVVASIGQKDAVGIVFGKYRLKGKSAVLMKKLINTRYLFILGGLPLVLEKLLGVSRQGKADN